MNPIKLISLLLMLCIAPVWAALDEPKPSQLEAKGVIAMRSGEYEQAEEVFRELIELRPDSYVGHYNLAAAQRVVGGCLKGDNQLVDQVG